LALAFQFCIVVLGSALFATPLYGEDKMKKRLLFYLLFCTTIMFYLIIGCNENESLILNSKSIEYLSHQSKGCGLSKDMGELEKINDEALFNWQYINSNLMLEVLFTGRCNLSIKDSVYTNDNDINIFLCETNESGARCVCQYKEVFNFTVTDKKVLRIILNYKTYSNKEYSVRADSVITLL
jgi:hypothetical protein